MCLHQYLFINKNCCFIIYTIGGAGEKGSIGSPGQPGITGSVVSIFF